MPLDFVDPSAADPTEEGTEPPKASNGGSVSQLVDGRVYRIECAGLPEMLHYQEHPQWCWAAAVQTAEHFQLGEEGYEPYQKAVVQRVYPEPEQVEDQTALSFQIAQALASKPVRESLEDIEIGDVDKDVVPTLNVLKDVIEFKASLDVSSEQLVDFIDQFVGAQEMTASLARGEPVLASLAEPPFRHIYIVYRVDVVPIRSKESREAKLRSIYAMVKAIQTQKSGGVMDKFNSANDSLTSTFKRYKDQVYAIKTVYLLDPWKDPGEKDPEKAETIVMSGEEFANRTFFMINQKTADRLISDFKADQEAAGEELMDSLN